MPGHVKGPRARGAKPSRNVPSDDCGGPSTTAESRQAQAAPTNGTELVLYYDTACHALAKAVAVDEVKDIHDKAIAMAVYARQAKNRDLEADAVALRMRATRKLDQLRQAQKDSVGLNRGAAGGGKKASPRGVLITPRDIRPTLESQGIDKNLAKQARVLGAMDDASFEHKVAEARASASRVYRRAIREAEIAQERAERRERTAVGGSVADLHALIASGYHAGVIAIDPAWPFGSYSERSMNAVIQHYETMSIEEIKALPVAQLAAPDCALFLWCTWPNMPIWHEVIEAWGFRYSALGFEWVKLNANGKGLHWGIGLGGTRQNPEPCLFARLGKPLRLDEGVHSVIMAPVGVHSEKPDEAYRRMQRLFGGPYLELFARKPRAGWTTWGDEIPAKEAAE
jgi:N6-adenosine-specific RNA methylase IME4